MQRGTFALGESFFMSAKKYKKHERHGRILNLIAATSAVGVSELASELGVSKQTVRRDLDELSGSGRINRTYGGGAVRPVGVEPTFSERTRTANEERAVIGRLAVSLLSENDVLMIGTGATALGFAQELVKSFERFHVFTNNVGVGTILAPNPNISVVLTPGNLDHREGCVHGPETLAFIDKFRADVAIYSASGLFEGGACEVHSDVAWVDRKMIKQSRRNMLLLDHSKYGHPHMEMVCPMGEIDIIVSDALPEPSLRAEIEGHGVQLMTPETSPLPDENEE